MRFITRQRLSLLELQDRLGGQRDSNLIGLTRRAKFFH